MTAARPANSPGNTANKTAASKRTPARRRKTAGQRLVAELSSDHDTYSVQVLIERAGQTADWLEHLDKVINGDRRAWLQLKIGTDTVEVFVDAPIREARQLQTELRHLLAEIFRQRAKLPIGGDDDDVLDGL